MAKKKEETYDWLNAVDLYKQALNVIAKKKFSKSGEIQERIGYCLYRRAFQADTRENLKRDMLKAIEAYDKALETYDNVESLEKLAKTSHCKAMTSYIRSRLPADLAVKREQLDKCWKLESQVLNAYEESAEHKCLGRACNNLLIFLIDRLEIEWDAELRNSIVEEALKHGEKAIEIFSKTQDRIQLAQAYASTAFFLKNAAFARGFTVKERKEYRKKALSYPQKAIEISEEIGDAYLIAQSNLRVASAGLDISGSTGLEEKQYYEKALQFSNLTEDKLLIARALIGLEFAAKNSTEAYEDPDKAKEAYKELLKYRDAVVDYCNIIAYDAGIAEAYWMGIDIPIEELSAMETDLKSKHSLLEEFARLGHKGLEHALLSGSMGVTFHTMRVLGWVLVRMARFETNTTKKTKLLEESSKYIEESISILKQASALSYVEPRELTFANCIWSLASNQVEMATTEKTIDEKIKLLKNAIVNMRAAREHWLRWAESPWTRVEKWIVHSEQWIGAGITEMIIGKTLNQLYALTNNIDVLSDAIKAFKKSIENYDKADSPFSRVAESYWQMAKIYNNMSNYEESARNFELASENYSLAAKKISQLKDFYQDHASYLQAWSEIETARNHISERQYRQAKEHYEKAANLHKSTERWNYLSLNYLAWARLEEAEDLSRREQTEEAKNLFQEVAKLFAEARESIKKQFEIIETEDEKKMATELVKASRIREQYCLGRISLEEAKILERQGDHAASSRKYISAAETFQKAADAMERKSDRQELRRIVDLCRAWHLMARAEAEASPDLYSKASKLFEEIKEHSPDDRAKLLALGHSRFCKALEAGTKFEDTRDTAMYSAAKKNLEAAESYYIKTGLKNASEYAKATRTLFDAYMYTHKAETEMDPRKKTQYYQVAERLLQASAGSYTKARYVEKSEQVRRLLENVQDKRQLAMSLSEVFHAPTITSTTTSFSTPTPTHEQAVGLERFEHTVIEAYLTASQEVKVGQEFEVRLDLVNVAQNFGLLVRIEDIVTPSLEVTALPPQHRIENGSLDMKGKRLEPLRVESVKLSLRPTEAGVISLNPRVIFVDELGKFKICTPKPATITVHPKLSFQFKIAAAQKVFNFLIDAFVQDYMRRRLPLDNSGWTTLNQIVKQAKVSKSSVYGPKGRRGCAVSELEKRGLVETRVFPGERGRGGRIIKMRIAYGKETVKRHVDQRVMKNKEK
jgi:tetratricopeptide (TPR) repeat protein